MKSILIVDDNKDILHSLQAGVSATVKECKVLIAQNGEKGHEILRSTPVDLVVTDLDMPVMNGFQFIEKARSDHPDVPVCVMAGNCQPEVVERLKAMGITKIIAKPFLFDHLTTMITEELGRQSAPSGPAVDG